MPRYVVNEGIQVPVNGEYASAGDTVEGEFQEWVDRGWLTPEGSAQPKPSPKKKSPDVFPIDDYDEKTAREIIKLMSPLEAGELGSVIQHEKAQKRPRKSIIKEANRLLTNRSSK